ncbi:MAG: AAA family ATPase [Gemmataceae bacterium]
MDWMKYLAGGAIFGIIASCWDKVKAILWRIASLLVQRVELNTEYVHNAVIGHLIANYQRSRSYDKIFGAWNEQQRDGRYALVSYEQFGIRNLIFWAGWRPFLFRNAIEAKAGKPETGENLAAGTKIYSTITYLRGTIDVEAIIREACTRFNHLSWNAASVEEEGRNRFVIHYVPSRSQAEEDFESSGNGLPWFQQPSYRLLAHSPDELGKTKLHQGKALEHLIFPARIKQLIREIELWRGSRQWYLERGIPWKRGWVLYGPPGTGKTALARAFAEDLNLPIYVYNLAELTNHELMQAWSSMQVNVPCIALLEDFDNVFHGRENVSRKQGMFPLMLGQKKEGEEGNAPRPFSPLTFDCLLNCLDGVERSDGVFTIITTNNIDKIDAALGQPRTLPDGTVEFISTRPGRIDKAVELTWMEPDDKKRLARRILADYPDEYQDMLDFIERFPELEETPAQFQERCAQKALACFWRANERERTDPCWAGPPYEWQRRYLEECSRARGGDGAALRTM